MQRRVKAATVAEVNAMARKPGRHSIGDSLILCVSPSGSKSWIARVRDAAGKRRDMGLGPFKDYSLAEARERAMALRKAGRDGQPILTRSERRRALQPDRVAPTFKELAEQYHRKESPNWKNGKHVGQWLKTLELYAFPKLGGLAVDMIGVPQIVEALGEVWQSAPETGRRVRQRVLAVLNFAHAMDYRPTQISSVVLGKGLGAQREVKGNFAALPYAEISSLMRSLQQGESIGNLALEFTILAAARSGEVRGATWDEFDLDAKLWTIPGERMKAGVEHVVPLCDRAVAIVRRAAEVRSSKTIVFPGLKDKAMSDATMAKALRLAGVPRERGTVHGMRSAFRDWVSEETSFPGDVAEAALAHMIKNKVEKAYRRGKLLEKRREMMGAWARYCAGATTPVGIAAA